MCVCNTCVRAKAGVLYAEERTFSTVSEGNYIVLSMFPILDFCISVSVAPLFIRKHCTERETEPELQDTGVPGSYCREFGKEFHCSLN